MSDVDSWAWASTDRLHDVLQKVAVIIEAEGTVPGDLAGHLARRLIAHEVAVGGPYTNDDGEMDREINEMVAALFRRLGRPLEYVEAFLRSSSTQAATTRHKGLDSQQSAAIQVVAQQLAKLPPDMAPIASHLLEAIQRADRRQEIASLSTIFVSSLRVSLPASRARRAQIYNQANVYTWLAYTVYDDIIDDEAVPRYLPVANLAHRHAVRLYLTDADTMSDDIYQVFQMMDAANAWEVAHCRFVVQGQTIEITSLPHYQRRGVLADRAMGHVLGPLLLAKSHPDLTLTQKRCLRNGLMQYLIARQLNDDFHDWQKDLSRGHCTPIVAYLLRRAKIAPGIYSIDKLTQQLRRVFWRYGVEEISALIQSHTRRARTVLGECGCLRRGSSFIGMTIDHIESSVEAGLVKHRIDKTFLRTFQE